MLIENTKTPGQILAVTLLAIPAMAVYPSAAPMLQIWALQRTGNNDWQPGQYR
jgi:hypothetical protein